MDAIIALMWRRKIDPGVLENLFHPHVLLSTLIEEENKVSPGLMFIRDKLNRPLIDTWERITCEVKVDREQKFMIKITYPLVDKTIFKADKIEILPTIDRGAVWLTHIEEDTILFKHDDTQWGYVLTSSEYANCGQTPDFMICNLKKPKENLRRSSKCVTNIVIKKIASECQTRAVMTNHTMWVPTENANEWRYLAPRDINMTINDGGNISQKLLTGSGILRIAPNMTMYNENVKFEYFDDNERTDVALVLIPEKVKNISWSKVNDLPGRTNREKIYTNIDLKKLFDLGVDVEDLKHDQPHLENLIYAPLENPWMSFSALAGVSGIILIILICKGKVTLCTRKTVIVPFGAGKVSDDKPNQKKRHT